MMAMHDWRARTARRAFLTQATRRAGVAAHVVALALAAAAPVAAQDQDVTRATSAVDVGPGAVSDASFKAAEFSGLQRQGAFPVGDFDLRGGGRYDGATARRWRLTGVDLGVTPRRLSAELAVQGHYRLSVTYDALLRNRSDSFQTPFDGAGTSSLLLPSTWQVPTVAGSTAASNTVNVTSARGLVPGLGASPYLDTQTGSPTLAGTLVPTAAQLARVLAASSADLPLFHDVALTTTRRSVDLALDYHFTDRWSVEASVRPEHRSGLKPLGVVSRATGGDISATVPDPIDTTTTQITANLHYKRSRAFAQAGVFGSFFRNRVGAIAVQNWALGSDAVSTMSSTPDTNFGQVNASAGYTVSSSTRVTASASAGLNTQNDPFLTDAATAVVPVESLHGRVWTTSAGLRVTSRPHRRLGLTAAYQLDQRDNRTAIHVFQFMDANQPLAANPAFPASASNPLGAVVATNAGANRHVSKLEQRADAAFDYRLSDRQRLSTRYGFQHVARACHGSWITCNNVDASGEHTLGAGWRLELGQAVTARVDYSHARRRAAAYNEDAFLALVPYANVSPAGALDGMTYYQYLRANGFTGWGPAAGYAATTGNANVFFPSNSETHAGVYAWQNRISELPGLRRFDVADRDRDRLRTSLDWAPGTAFSVQTGVAVNDDRYPDARYGLRDGRTLSASADVSYALEHGAVTVYYAYEELGAHSAGNTLTANSNVAAVSGATLVSGSGACNTFTTILARNNNAKLDPCLDWSTRRFELAHTAGLDVTRRFFGVDVTAAVAASRARSRLAASGGNYANNPAIPAGAPATTIGAFYLPTAPLPDIPTDTLDARLTAVYRVRAGQALRVRYGFQHMRSDDWGYQGLQIGEGTLANVLPTNETAFRYDVHALAVSYVFTF